MVYMTPKVGMGPRKGGSWCCASLCAFSSAGCPDAGCLPLGGHRAPPADLPVPPPAACRAGYPDVLYRPCVRPELLDATAKGRSPLHLYCCQCDYRGPSACRRGQGGGARLPERGCVWGGRQVSVPRRALLSACPPTAAARTPALPPTTHRPPPLQGALWRDARAVGHTHPGTGAGVQRRSSRHTPPLPLVRRARSDVKVLVTGRQGWQQCARQRLTGRKSGGGGGGGSAMQQGSGCVLCCNGLQKTESC